MLKKIVVGVAVCAGVMVVFSSCKKGTAVSTDPWCGDGECNGDETPRDCPEDCSWYQCGNGICEGGEPVTCPEDCHEQSCGNGMCESHENPSNCYSDCGNSDKVDILFVVDNSGGTASMQHLLYQHFGIFRSRLIEVCGEMPDVHIGVVSTDLGAGDYTSIRYCQTPGGDGGVLGMSDGFNDTEVCVGPGQKYMADRPPQGCNVQRSGAGECTGHDCTEQNCEGSGEDHELITLQEDNEGCPRCRNFAGSARLTFECITGLGVNGCGFEHQMEAMKKALDVNETPENEGFLRSDSLLAVVFATDEDDCSASDPEYVFNPDPELDDPDSELGCLKSFRCFEFGVSCDIDGREPGPRHDCHPNEDDSIMYNIQRYTQFLGYLKEPGEMIMASVAGTVDDVIYVVYDTMDCHEVKLHPSGMAPGIRLKALVSKFNSPDDLEEWAYGPVTSQSAYENLMVGLVNKIGERLGCEGAETF